MLTLCKLGVLSFEISPRKYAMQKCTLPASWKVTKYNPIFNTYERTKYQTMDNLHVRLNVDLDK